MHLKQMEKKTPDLKIPANSYNQNIFATAGDEVEYDNSYRRTASALNFIFGHYGRFSQIIVHVIAQDSKISHASEELW